MLKPTIQAIRHSREGGDPYGLIIIDSDSF